MGKLDILGRDFFKRFGVWTDVLDVDPRRRPAHGVRNHFNDLWIMERRISFVTGPEIIDAAMAAFPAGQLGGDVVTRRWLERQGRAVESIGACFDDCERLKTTVKDAADEK